MAESSTPTHYDLLGGDAGIRRLVDRFYDLMDTAPEATHVRALHKHPRHRPIEMTSPQIKLGRQSRHSFVDYGHIRREGRTPDDPPIDTRQNNANEGGGGGVGGGEGEVPPVALTPG